MYNKFQSVIDFKMKLINILILTLIISFSSFVHAKDKTNKLPVKLKCDDNLLCTIPETAVGVKCNGGKLNWIFDKKAKSFFSPNISEYLISFSSQSAYLLTSKIVFGPAPKIIDENDKDSYLNLSSKWLLDRKSLVLFKKWEYLKKDSKYSNLPHDLYLRDDEHFALLLGEKPKKVYIMSFKKPIKHAQCEIVRPYLIIKPYIDKIKAAKKDNKI